MQISKFSVMICAAAVFAGPSLVRADDTAAQAKMRDALRQNMATTSVQSPSAVPARASTPVSAPASVSSPDAQAQMREALRQKMATTSMQSPAPASAANVAKPADPETQNKLREALRVKMAEADAQKQAQAAAAKPQPAMTPAVSMAPTVMSTPEKPATAVKPVAVVATPAKTPAKPSDTSLKVAQGEALKQAAVATPVYDPSLPISAEKQKELNALLMLYQADSITAQEYHEKRAKILSAP